MKKILFCLPLFVAVPVAADVPADDSENETLPLVVITSGRLEVPEQLSAGNYQVVERSTIEQTAASTIEEVLETISGIQISDFSGNGSFRTFGMRGFGENSYGNTLILVDGRKLNNTLDIANASLSQINLDDVERIEVLHGSGGVLFGENAVGGVINIVTRRRTGRYLDLSVTRGSYDKEVFSASGTIDLTEEWQFSASGENRYADNYRVNSALKRSSHRVRFDYRPGKNHLFAELSRHDELVGAPAALTKAQVTQNRRQTTTPNDFVDTDQEALALGARLQLAPNWRFEIDYNWQDDDIDSALFFGGTNFGNSQQRRQWSYHPRMLYQHKTRHGTASVAIGSDYERARYENIGFPANTAAQRSLSNYVFASVPVSDAVTLDAGIRHYDVDTDVNTGSNLDVDNSDWVHEAAIRYEISNQIGIFLRRSESFRFAKADEIGFADRTPLKPQTGVSWESGLTGNFSTDTFSISVYKLNLENEIAFDRTLGAFGLNTNLDPTQRIGAEARWEHQLSNMFSTTFSHSWVDARFTSGPNKNENIPFTARRNSTIGIRWNGMRGHSAQLEAKFIGDRSTISDKNNVFDRIDGHQVVNLGWRWKGKAVGISARLNNVLDQRYDSLGTSNPSGATNFFPAPERNFLVRVEYRLGEQ